MIALPALSLRTWLSIGGAVVLLIAGVWLRAHWIGVGEDRVQVRWDAREAVYARERAEAVTAARVLEQRHRDELRAAADRFLTEQRKADENHAAVVAGLRAGTVRLRQRLTCPRDGTETPAGSRGFDETGRAGLLPADAEFLLREAARADEIARQLNALIQAVEAERK